MLWLAGVMIVLLLRWLLLLLLLLLLLSGQIDKGMISLVDKREGLAANLGSVLVPSPQQPPPQQQQWVPLPHSSRLAYVCSGTYQ